MAVEDQPALIPGWYRCDGCYLDVAAVTRWRDRRLCPACVERIFPAFHPLRGGDGEVRTEDDRKAMGRVWEWYDESRSRRPPRSPSPSKRVDQVAPHADSLYPLCACGNRREETHFRAGGLFGGPFLPECPRCNLRRAVESTFQFQSSIHPEWDDETWLDFLYRVYPEAFALGVLPDYWFELKYPGMTKKPPAPEPVDPLARQGNGNDGCHSYRPRQSARPKSTAQ